MACSIINGYIEPDEEFQAIFTETYTKEEFEKKWPDGVFMELFESRGNREYCGWLNIKIKNGRLWMEWGEPGA